MTYNIKLPFGDETISIELVRKDIKNARLKVFANGRVLFSVPKGVSDKWIEEYIKSRKDWIKERVAIYSQTTGIESVYALKSGVSVKLLGQNKIILIKLDDKNDVELTSNTIMVHVKDSGNEEKTFSVLETWLKTELSSVAEKKLEKFYPIIQKHGIAKPEINIRKMKTMWGNCQNKKGKITLNFYLYQAAPGYIEYVILHELIHFVYRNHTRQFYDLLSIYMPDWQERKKVLDFEVVQGITP